VGDMGGSKMHSVALYFFLFPSVGLRFSYTAHWRVYYPLPSGFFSLIVPSIMVGSVLRGVNFSRVSFSL
jgi:hypothetical protein